MHPLYEIRLKQFRRGECVYCGSVSGEPLHQDHIDPLSRGGDHSFDNTVWACQDCNSSKGGRFILEWVWSGTAPVAGANRRRSPKRMRESIDGHPARHLTGEERAEYIAARRRAGATLREIGDEIHVSNERVRQILAAAGVESTGRVVSTLDPLIVMRVARTSSVCSVRALADLIGTTPKQVTALLTMIGAQQSIRRMFRMRERREAKAKIIAQLQAWTAQSGRAPLVKELTNNRLPGLPSGMNCHRLFGSVSNATIAAGLGPSRRRGSPGHLAPRKPADHCRQGHEFTPANEKQASRGTGLPKTRICRECDRIRRKRYKARKAAGLVPVPSSSTPSVREDATTPLPSPEAKP